MRWLFAALAMGALACGKQPEGPLSVVQTRVPEGIRLTLIAKSSVQINAQLKPALELKDGTILRFDTPHVTADSAYFTASPELLLPTGIPAKGKIRASVCDSGEAVCRLAVVSLR
jgi:hypothetical protein